MRYIALEEDRLCDAVASTKPNAVMLIVPRTKNLSIPRIKFFQAFRCSSIQCSIQLAARAPLKRPSSSPARNSKIVGKPRRR